MPMITGRRHYVASRRERSRDYASPPRAKDCSWCCIRSFAVDASTEAWIDPRLPQGIGEGPSMSDETRDVFQAWLRHGRVLALALTAAAVAACSGQGDGSVGVGTGQDPDPVAPDFPIAYTKGPLNDADD